jgi:hypothetical protein
MMEPAMQIIAGAARSLVEHDDDFWILGALSGGSYEEKSKGDFAKYVYSYESVGLELHMLTKLRQGTNGNLCGLLRGDERILNDSVTWDQYEKGRDHGKRPDIVFDFANGQACVLEIKLVHDCTKEKYFGNVSADIKKLECICGDRLGFLIVFFTQLPHFDYPAGSWSHVGKFYEERRTDTNIVGIDKQYSHLRKLLPPAAWPNGDLPFRRNLIASQSILDKIPLRYQSVFTPSRLGWNFDPDRHLRDAQVGVAIWSHNCS